MYKQSPSSCDSIDHVSSLVLQGKPKQVLITCYKMVQLPSCPRDAYSYLRGSVCKDLLFLEYKETFQTMMRQYWTPSCGL